MALNDWLACPDCKSRTAERKAGARDGSQLFECEECGYSEWVE